MQYIWSKFQFTSFNFFCSVIMPTCLSKITQIFFPFQDVNPLPENTFLFCLQSFQSILLFVNNKAKGRISKGDKKTKHAKFPEKRSILTPWYVHLCLYVCLSGGKKCSVFFGKFDVPCFLVRSVLRVAFLPCYRRLPTYRVPLSLHQSPIFL